MSVLAGTGRLGSIAGQFAFSSLMEVSITGLLCTAGVMLLLGACVAWHYSVRDGLWLW